MRKLLITIGLITGAGSLFAGPIHDAAYQGDIDEIKSLLNIGVNVDHIDRFDRTPLVIAAQVNNYEVADLLISVGADVNYQAKNGMTPIFDTGFQSKEKILKLLINNGADINHKDREGKTPLFYMFDIFSLKILLQNGAEVNVQSASGSTPLMGRANYDYVKLLLENGANAALQDVQGRNALHYAAIPGSYADLDTLKLLITRVDVNATDIYSMTALDYLNDWYDDNRLAFKGAEQLRLLKEAGAKTGLQLLEQKVEQGSTGNTNPTDEWPRKMWEIETSDAIDSYIEGENKSVLIRAGQNSYWATRQGNVYKLNNLRISKLELIHLSNENVIYKVRDGATNYKAVLLSIVKGKVIERRDSVRAIRWPEVQHHFSIVGVEQKGSVITGWDFTPPTLASTDNEGGNNGGNTAMSRLSIGTSGPDISIATDGKLGGPAELQKSNDLKNWRKLSDVPADSTDLLITPRDSGNEFFRLKRVGE